MNSKKLIAALVAGFIIVVLVILITAGRPSGSYVSQIERLGWQTDEDTVEVADIVIPEIWDSTMKEYNDLQKKAGYDLTKYKGKTAKLYSYAVLNYDGYNNVKIDLIIYDTKIIGGDICTPAIDGFMLPLIKREEVF